MPKPAKIVPTSTEKAVASVAEQLLRRALEIEMIEFVVSLKPADQSKPNPAKPKSTKRKTKR